MVESRKMRGKNIGVRGEEVQEQELGTGLLSAIPVLHFYCRGWGRMGGRGALTIILAGVGGWVGGWG